MMIQKNIYQVSNLSGTPTLVTGVPPLIRSTGKWPVGAASTRQINGSNGFEYYAFYANSGTPLTMSVTFDGAPKPTIQWQKRSVADHS